VNNRLSSGNQRLDGIMHGGLLKNGINLIVGVPGSGKTILSQQFMFANATREHPALYLSTLSEPPDKILRYGEGFEFFDQAALRDGRVIYEDIGPVLSERGLADVLETIDGYLKRIRPGIVVIDSFRIFHAFATDITDFRRFLYDLARRLSASPTTSVWNAPYAKAQALEAAEFAVADGIIALDMKLISERETRTLQVLKLRGSDFRSGEHSYRISKAGFLVFPRLADPVDESPYELSARHTGTGIGALDELLGEAGYWAGSTTLIAGPAGIGKTLMGLHYIYQGARGGEPGILATFQENRSQLARVVESLGWSLDDPNVHILHRSVVAMNIDEWVYEVLDLAERTEAKRIVVDSLADVISAARDPVRFREWMFSLAQRCTRAGVGLMMIMEVPELFAPQRVSEEGISHFSDNIVLLQYVQEGPELVRALTILKTRAMRHRPVVHRYDITDKGFVLGDEVTISR
jgi:circadian clock protein KaiC